MSEIPVLRQRIRDLEEGKPDAAASPYQHKAVNDEIARICDRIHELKAPFKPRAVA